MERWESGRFAAGERALARGDPAELRGPRLLVAAHGGDGGGGALARDLVGGRQDPVGRRWRPGKFFSFVGAILLLYTPVKQIGRVGQIMMQGIAGAERVFEILDTVPAVRDSGTRAAAAVPEGDPVRAGPLRLRRAGRPGRDRRRDPEGERWSRSSAAPAAGRAPSRTSSRASGIPIGGRITVDGRDIRDVTLASLAPQLALVTQDTILFNDTVRANIAYGRPDVSQAEVEEAARMAQAHDFICAMEQGYDTQVGEKGVRLSGGQRQRIAIARAFLKNAPILVLDEATSALDVESEREVQRALDSLMGIDAATAGPPSSSRTGSPPSATRIGSTSSRAAGCWRRGATRSSSPAAASTPGSTGSSRGSGPRRRAPASRERAPRADGMKSSSSPSLLLRRRLARASAAGRSRRRAPRSTRRPPARSAARGTSTRRAPTGSAPSTRWCAPRRAAGLQFVVVADHNATHAGRGRIPRRGAGDPGHRDLERLRPRRGGRAARGAPGEAEQGRPARPDRGGRRRRRPGAPAPPAAPLHRLGARRVARVRGRLERQLLVPGAPGARAGPDPARRPRAPLRRGAGRPLDLAASRPRSWPASTPRSPPRARRGRAAAGAPLLRRRPRVPRATARPSRPSRCTSR